MTKVPTQTPSVINASSVARGNFGCRHEVWGFFFFVLIAVCGCDSTDRPPVKQQPPSEKPNVSADAQSASQKQSDAEPREQLLFKDYNLVFVSFDALQAAHVSCLGYPRKVTPTIDSIAARGFNFRKATPVSSWTVPSSMTWFTGVYPSGHHIVNKYAICNPAEIKIADLRELSPDLVTLADVLKQHGYATGGFTGNAGVGGGFGYEQGFDTYYYVKGKFGRMDESIPRALEWLKTKKDKKFFLFLHGYDVHGQSTPPAVTTIASSTKTTISVTEVRNWSKNYCAKKVCKRARSRCATRTCVSGERSTTRRFNGPMPSSSDLSMNSPNLD
ncbi:MAG: hypothetical protein CMJ78_03520 [Planctomycetaceae bacterium]|nr:hypothetical protein [Planctomycetaceae bacterium]